MITRKSVTNISKKTKKTGNRMVLSIAMSLDGFFGDDERDRNEQEQFK